MTDDKDLAALLARVEHPSSANEMASAQGASDLTVETKRLEETARHLVRPCECVGAENLQLCANCNELPSDLAWLFEYASRLQRERNGWRRLYEDERAKTVQRWTFAEQAAADAEREACARIVEDKSARFFFERSPEAIREIIASAIRQRAEAPEAVPTADATEPLVRRALERLHLKMDVRDELASLRSVAEAARQFYGYADEMRLSAIDLGAAFPLGQLCEDFTLECRLMADALARAEGATPPRGGTEEVIEINEAGRVHGPAPRGPIRDAGGA